MRPLGGHARPTGTSRFDGPVRAPLGRSGMGAIWPVGLEAGQRGPKGARLKSRIDVNPAETRPRASRNSRLKSHCSRQAVTSEDPMVNVAPSHGFSTSTARCQRGPIVARASGCGALALVALLTLASSSSAENPPAGSAQPAPSTTAQPAPSSSVQPTPSGTAQPTPYSTSQPAPISTAAPAPSSTVQPATNGSAQPTAPSPPALASLPDKIDLCITRWPLLRRSLTAILGTGRISPRIQKQAFDTG